jgi:hypothetical protein
MVQEAAEKGLEAILKMHAVDRTESMARTDAVSVDANVTRAVKIVCENSRLIGASRDLG